MKTIMIELTENQIDIVRELITREIEMRYRVLDGDSSKLTLRDCELKYITDKLNSALIGGNRQGGKPEMASPHSIEKFAN